MSPSPRAGRVSNTPRVTISSLNPHPATPSSTGISQTHPTDVCWWITGGVGASHQWWQRGVLFIGVCKKKNHAENTCGESIPVCIMWVSSCCTPRALSKRQEAEGSILQFGKCQGKKKLILIVSLKKKKNHFSPFCFSQCFFYLFVFQAADQGVQL